MIEFYSSWCRLTTWGFSIISVQASLPAGNSLLQKVCSVLPDCVRRDAGELRVEALKNGR